MPIIIIIALIIGGGVSIGAEKAVPGKALYPVKVAINENVRGVFSFSTKGKANWNVRIAERRLEEAEKLATESSFNAEARASIEANFAAHVARVREHIMALKAKENLKTAAEVAANLETSLKAHEAILDRLASTSTEPKGRSELQALVLVVQNAKITASQDRADLEAAVSAKGEASVQAAAEGKLIAAQNKIDEVDRFITETRGSAEADATAEATARLILAENTLAEGKIKLEAKAYGEAFTLFSSAARIAQEAKLLLQANLKIHVDLGGALNLGNNRTNTAAEEGRTKASTSIDVRGGGVLRAPTSTATTSVDAEARIKIKIGE